MSRKIFQKRRRSKQQTQQLGVAAIEFAFIFVAIFLFLYCIATFGVVFYTQHILTRAAENGARVVSMYSQSTPTELQSRIESAVRESLGPLLQEVSDTPQVVLGTPVIVTVRYAYRSKPILPVLPLISAWVPEFLQGRAVAASSAPL
ncbi:TadE/TadG family type IV pilus assembly protein [Variovorax paradoxus]|uniref:TadE/TadG family type IV pilus assembly protein n=1 Tax=Variovorax paradoxus TaxID=34073 RepID=UPI003ECD32EA